MKTIKDFGVDYKERVEKAISCLQAGKGILLVDDENRENEGDIIYSAEKMTVKDMALMIRECSGIVCLCLTSEKCRSLGLHQMVDDNTSKNQTAFTISISQRRGNHRSLGSRQDTNDKNGNCPRRQTGGLIPSGTCFPPASQR